MENRLYEQFDRKGDLKRSILDRVKTQKELVNIKTLNDLCPDLIDDIIKIIDSSKYVIYDHCKQFFFFEDMLDQYSYYEPDDDEIPPEELLFSCDNDRLDRIYDSYLHNLDHSGYYELASEAISNVYHYLINSRHREENTF